MNIDNINIEKKIYKISVEYMESDLFMMIFNNKSKMLLFCEKLNKLWYLNPRRGYYPHLPSVQSDTLGIYIFWFKHNKKYYPLEVGSGILNKRIHTKFFKHTFDIPDLYVSFKRADRDKLLKLEKNYIEKLYPVINKQYNNILSKKYLKNLKIYHDYTTIQDNLRKKAFKLEKNIQKKEDNKIKKERDSNEALDIAFAESMI